jgi:cell division protein FtsZ
VAAPIQVVHNDAPLRTGTDNLPILNQAIAPQVQATPMHDYSALSTPSVWRSGRTQAAAKVDALASNGMDEIEIPAFLRKQAD